jgi:hypothetical protein
MKITKKIRSKITKKKNARDASVKRGWNLCGRVRERGAFSVWGDIARKGCHFDGEVSMPTGGSVKAVRTTGEHVASVGGSYGCGEGGERRAVLCECFSLLILPTLLSGRFSTLRSFFRLSYSKPVWAKNLVCFPNVDFRSAWICIRMDIFRFPFFRCFTKNSGSF